MRRTSAPPKVAGSASNRSTGSWESATCAMRRSNQRFDQIRSRRGEAFSQPLVEVVHVVDARARHAHAAGERNPVEIGAAEIEHVERLAADVLRADLRELVAQD